MYHSITLGEVQVSQLIFCINYRSVVRRTAKLDTLDGLSVLCIQFSQVVLPTLRCSMLATSPNLLVWQIPLQGTWQWKIAGAFDSHPRSIHARVGAHFIRTVRSPNTNVPVQKQKSAYRVRWRKQKKYGRVQSGDERQVLCVRFQKRQYRVYLYRAFYPSWRP